ncbi:uncharacterized protein LOC121385488 [Gigantopelta aegis]|uniref:uncharacterized protein LOC121385488 n=1 Tax=Gigantopelta aegis TaxID=1735272 RepID=UPI001B887B38|nr:uncharacterized protein LOC121385488 [Gigantopelta aegis]
MADGKTKKLQVLKKNTTDVQTRCQESCAIDNESLIYGCVIVNPRCRREKVGLLCTSALSSAARSSRRRVHVLNNKPLYVYVGDLNSTTLTRPHYFTVPDNNPTSCDKQCAMMTPFIGLQATMCLCLHTVNRSDLTTTPGSRMYKCPGSFLETCGSPDYISVYKNELSPLDFVSWRPSTEGMCGFIKYNNNFKHFHLETDECSTERSLLCTRTDNSTSPDCRGSVCVKRDSMNWADASRVCSLVSITKSNESDLKSLVEHMPSCWIGLRRSRQWVWLDGGNVKASVINGSGHDSRECLISSTDWATNRYSAASCTKRLPAICVKYPEAQKNNQNIQQDFTSTGIAIGAGIAAVIICGIVLNWIRRNKCGKQDEEDDTPPGYYCHFGKKLDKDVDLATSTTLSHMTVENGVSDLEDKDAGIEVEQSSSVNDGGYVTAVVTSALPLGSSNGDYFVVEKNPLEIQRNCNENDSASSSSSSALGLSQNIGHPTEVVYDRPIKTNEIYTEVQKSNWRPPADDSVASYSHLNTSDYNRVGFYDTANIDGPTLSSSSLNDEMYSRLKYTDDGA